MEDKHLYMAGVLIEKRSSDAPEAQKVFTKYGDCILSRFGIHDFDDENGLISLNIRAGEEYLKEFENELSSIKGVTVKHMMLK